MPAFRNSNPCSFSAACAGGAAASPHSGVAETPVLAQESLDLEGRREGRREGFAPRVAGGGRESGGAWPLGEPCRTGVRDRERVVCGTVPACS